MILTLCLQGNFFYDILSSADFFLKSTFSKRVSRLVSECQTVWVEIRPNVLSGLIWVQTVCKGYQQMTLVGKELRKKERHLSYCIPI